MIKKNISIFIIAVIALNSLSFALTPQPVQAASVVTQNAVEFTGCATGGILSSYLSAKLGTYVDKLRKRATDAARKAAEAAAKKAIEEAAARALADSIKVPVADSTTKSAIDNVKSAVDVAKSAVDTGNDQFLNKAYITDVIARCAARQILSAMINNIYTVMRTSGRDGGVTFVRNWSTFLAQAQYRGENIFRAELSTAQLCDYLADGIKKSFGVDPKKKTPITGQSTRIDSLQPFGLATKCTMPVGFTPQKYQQDFAGNGGWDAFSRMLEPQNNAWGLAALSQNEIAKQRALQQAADTSQAIAGKGYTGISGRGKTDSCLIKSPSGGDCAIYKDIKTTGSYIADSVGAGVAAELTWLTSAQQLNSIIANLTEVLLNRMLNEGSPDEGKPRIDNSGDTQDGIPTPTPETPTPEPTPSVPTPLPEGEPVSFLADIQTERAKYGTPMSPTELGKLLNAVAWKNQAIGWALLGKSSGTNCPAPNGALVSCDFLIHQPTLLGYDVLIGQEDQAIPTWNSPEDLSESIRTGARTIVLPNQP